MFTRGNCPGDTSPFVNPRKQTACHENDSEQNITGLHDAGSHASGCLILAELQHAAIYQIRVGGPPGQCRVPDGLEVEPPGTLVVKSRHSTGHRLVLFDKNNFFPKSDRLYD